MIVYDHINKTMIASDPKLEFFKTKRPELYNYVLNKVIPGNIKIKLVKAPVKSGKRGMVEINALLHPENIHVYLTALHRISDVYQHKELESYNIAVFSINNKTKKNDCILFINNNIQKNKTIIIHLDELDFGCGDKQLLNDIYSFYKNNINVEFILYSATIEVAKKEFLVAYNINDFYECNVYTPPSSYYGIKKYLDNGKFIQASSFISCNINSLEITQQGKDLINILKKDTENKHNKKHIAVLRLSSYFKIEGENKSQFEFMKENQISIENEYNIRLKFIGSNDDSIKWDDEKYWEELNFNMPFIFVINQVSGRSTEWKCHPYLCWFHTLRGENTPTSTIIQDQERAVYYVTNYTNEIDILIYGDVPSAQYSAGIITFEQYDAMTTRKISSRLNTKSKKNHIKVKRPMIYDSWEDIPLQYRSRRSKNSHVKEEYKLTQNMILKDLTYEIKNWDKYSHLEGFLMTNIRSSREKFIKGKCNQKAIWFESDIMKELSEGINENSKVRINLFYKDGETDKNNFKFIVREFDSSEEANVTNTSMYNC